MGLRVGNGTTRGPDRDEPDDPYARLAGDFPQGPVRQGLIRSCVVFYRRYPTLFRVIAGTSLRTTV
jgi:hypothetical protein